MSAFPCISFGHKSLAPLLDRLVEQEGLSYVLYFRNRAPEVEGLGENDLEDLYLY
jgi:hypothetical protein